MKHLIAPLALAFILVSVRAQTLYVPSGINGIGPSSQNVGVGTSSPDELLSVGLLGTAANVKVGSWAFLGHESSHYTTILGGNVKALGSHSVVAQTTIDGYRAIRMKYDEGITFHTYLGSVTANEVIAQERMRIDVAGRVGIGTASPVARLEVARDSSLGDYTTSALHLSSATTPGKQLRAGYDPVIDAGYLQVAHTAVAVKPLLLNPSGGNVSIGTTANYRTLTVQGDGYFSDGHRGALLGHDSSQGGRSFLVLDKNAQNGVGSGGDYVYLAQEDGQGVLTSASGTQLVLQATGGNVSIGTVSTGSHKLTVNGAVRAKEVVVDTGWSDYVFAADYELAPLSEIEAHIKEHQHLPGIPSAAEVAEHGVSIGEMQAKLLAKLEEMTLHLITQQKQISAHLQRIERLEAENAQLKSNQ